MGEASAQAGGIVAAGHPETAAAGRALLEAGGNAFDAVIGGICAAMVCEPLLISLAGGGFLLARPAGAEPELFDFFVHTPARRRPVAEIDFHPIDADFGTTTQEFHVGLGSAAVPGMAAGVVEVHAALGRLPLDEVLAPAIALARQGVEITSYQARVSEILRCILALSPEAMALVATEDAPTRPARAGERVLHRDLADTFEQLVEHGRPGFYAGEFADRLVDACRAGGGQLTHEDLLAYRVLRRAPVRTRAFGADIWLNAPPSPGGSLVAFALALLEAVPLHEWAWDSAAARLAVARAMDAANRLRAQMESEDYERALAGVLDDETRLAEWRAHALPRDLFSRGTTHISVADAEGNLASLTASNGEGCGFVVPGSGVMMNNMLGEQDLNPGGFHRWAPGTRLASMMCPTLARLADGSEIACGTGGSNRIRGAVLQVLLNLCGFGMPLERAITTPRLHVEGARLSFESGLDDAAAAALVKAWPDHEVWPDLSLFFGGVHAVRRWPEEAAGQGVGGSAFDGAGDPRRGGAVARAGT